MIPHHKFNLSYKSIFTLIILIIESSCSIRTPIAQPATQTAQSARQTLYASLFAQTPTSQPAETSLAPTTVSPTSVLPTQEQPLGSNIYLSQSGDTIEVVAKHFNILTEEIQVNAAFAPTQLLPVGTPLTLLAQKEIEAPYAIPILPDSEVIYGPGSKEFDLSSYVDNAGGFLPRYSEVIDGKTYSGTEIVQMIAVETSTNPRLLLAFLDFRSGWVSRNPTNAENDPYPIGYDSPDDKWLYKEMMITARFLAEGYYGWRYGTLNALTFLDAPNVIISPTLNAGSVAVQKLFSMLYYHRYWEGQLYGDKGFLMFYENMFGDPWERASQVEPLLSSENKQPDLALPFLPGLKWSFTAGPHAAWQTGTPRAAVDFAPVTGEAACAVSTAWTTAAAPGLVVRSMRGTLALDLDNDGDEGTGWVLVYMHVAEHERATLGTQLPLDGFIGHPSCERGNATGTHVHFTRKYNGEWIATDGPLPLIMDGWQAFAGLRTYEGTLVRAYQTVTASPQGVQGSSIFRDDY
jgi:hypothetical protein